MRPMQIEENTYNVSDEKDLESLLNGRRFLFMLTFNGSAREAIGADDSFRTKVTELGLFSNGDLSEDDAKKIIENLVSKELHGKWRQHVKHQITRSPLGVLSPTTLSLLGIKTLGKDAHEELERSLSQLGETMKKQVAGGLSRICQFSTESGKSDKHLAFWEHCLGLSDGDDLALDGWEDVVLFDVYRSPRNQINGFLVSRVRSELSNEEIESFLHIRKLDDDLRRYRVDGKEVFDFPPDQEYESAIANSVDSERRVYLLQRLQYHRIENDFGSMRCREVLDMLKVDKNDEREFGDFCMNHAKDMKSLRGSEELKILHRVLNRVPAEKSLIVKEFFKDLWGL